jgi:acetyl esterase/lipase
MTPADVQGSGEMTGFRTALQRFQLKLAPAIRWLRLSVGILSIGLGLLVIVPPPGRIFWMLSIGVTEWGHIVALFGLSTLFPGWKTSRPAKIGATLGLAGMLLTLSTIVRAHIIADRVRADVSSAFGHADPTSNTRPAPLALSEIICGVSYESISPTTHIYSSPNGNALKLDVYAPPDNSGLGPAVLMIHGGSWRSGDRTQLPAINSYLASRGYAVAAIDYRLAPANKFPAALEDVRAALLYLKGHASELRIDPTRIVIMGRSAGGHLALLSAYTAADPAIRGVIALYPPTDMPYAHAHPSNPLVLDSKRVLEDFLGGSPDEMPDAYRAASPTNFVDATTPPTLLIHGERDDVVYITHSERIAELLANHNRKHFLLRIPWGHHGCDANLSGPSGQLLLYAIERFLASVMK